MCTQDGKNEVDVFFHHLEIDLGKIDVFTRQQETTCYDHQQSLLHTVRNGLKKSDIFDVYTETRALSSYQELNKTCFEKIIKKFHKRMGLRLGTKKTEEETARTQGKELSPKEKSDLRHRCDAFMESVEDAYFLNLEKLDIATALQSLHVCAAHKQGYFAFFLSPTPPPTSFHPHLPPNFHHSCCTPKASPRATRCSRRACWRRCGRSTHGRSPASSTTSMPTTTSRTASGRGRYATPCVGMSSAPAQGGGVVRSSGSKKILSTLHFPQMTYACKIVCGSTNRNLARNVSRCLGHKSLCAATVEVRDNGECDLQVLDNV